MLKGKNYKYTQFGKFFKNSVCITFFTSCHAQNSTPGEGLKNQTGMFIRIYVNNLLTLKC